MWSKGGLKRGGLNRERLVEELCIEDKDCESYRNLGVHAII